jgi:hypothetical protein
MLERPEAVDRGAIHVPAEQLDLIVTRSPKTGTRD